MFFFLDDYIIYHLFRNFASNMSIKEKMKEKCVYNRPFMRVESFTPNEYVSGCDFKWKYEGTGVPGNFVCEGTYNRLDDFWFVFRGWQGGDPIHENNWKTDAAATFYTNDDSLPDQLGNTPNYSGSQGELHIAVLFNWYDFDLEDGEVYKYHNAADGKDYYSADRFVKKRNYS